MDEPCAWSWEASEESKVEKGGLCGVIRDACMEQAFTLVIC